LALKVTLPPEQKAVAPPAEIVAAGALPVATVVAALVVLHVPLLTTTV
jgi:hypothetical protein